MVQYLHKEERQYTTPKPMKIMKQMIKEVLYLFISIILSRKEYSHFLKDYQHHCSQSPMRPYILFFMRR
jgi:hypothetical protein